MSRSMLVAVAACCVGPMAVIVAAVTVLGVALGPAVSVTLGLVVAVLCISVMVERHSRARGATDADHHQL